MNVRLAKPFGVCVGKLRDRLEALSYRCGRPQFAIFNGIVPYRLRACLKIRGARRLKLDLHSELDDAVGREVEECRRRLGVPREK